MADNPQPEDPAQSDSNQVLTNQKASPETATLEATTRSNETAAEFPMNAQDVGVTAVSAASEATNQGYSTATQALVPNTTEQYEGQREKLNPLIIGCGVLFWVAVGIGLLSINQQLRTFFLSNMKWLLIGVGIIALITVFFAGTRRVKEATAQSRIALIIFLVIPLVMIAVTTVILLPTEYRAAPLKMIFLLCVCLLPATMYYLFIATKKNSILNEFILNLDRLGLLEAGSPYGAAGARRENEDERKNRILTYLQRFEAAYGAFPTDLSQYVLKPTNLSQVVYERSKSEGSSFASIFTVETTVPVILTTVLIALGWLITLPPWYGNMPTRDVTGQSLDWLHIFIPVRTPVHFAFIGAYFFSLQMLFRRYVRRDLRPSAYVAVSLRIILAVIGTWVAVASMSSVLTRYNATEVSLEATNQLLVLGFIIGVFPRVVWQIVGAVARKFGGFILRLPSLQTDLPVTDLDGLTVWHESRLEEEDIENIPNMATADLIEMLLTTRIPPDRLIDWVDQAILYTHLGPEKSKTEGRREKLRAQGIRTGSALIESYARSVDRGDEKEFEKILTDNGGANRSPILSLIDTMQTNPNLRLIQNWRGLEPFQLQPQLELEPR
ncbi:MAG TPA: hypothetical protein VJT15_17485 [Pyrinomonadaceae bacterium]|nr:hypothetical protein [Pyrinomonadaceae bacterium]